MRMLTVLLISLSLSALVSAQEKEKFMSVSWGDIAPVAKFKGVAKLDTPDKAREAVQRWKSHGVDKVLFRMDDFRILLFADIHADPKDRYLREWSKLTKQAWEDGLVQTLVDALVAEGIEVLMWIAITDQGRPPDVHLFDTSESTTFWPWHLRFTKENPQYVVHDRSLTINQRKYHWHVMEYAYPEVRDYMLDVIRTFSDRFDFDGVFLSVRCHGYPPRHADEFGFNEPIVQEYQRRYGRDILREDFDLEKWRELRGEYFTTFLQEVKTHLKTKGQKLSIGVQQGEYVGPPIGNMRIQWRRWVSEGIIDDLVLGHITRVRRRYPLRIQRTWGYLKNQESGVGLPPVDEAIRQEYGPLCKRHGVKLYVEPGSFYNHYDHPAIGRGGPLPDIQKELVAKLEAIPEVTGLPISYLKATQPAQ